MGMHITVEVVDSRILKKDIDSIYEYFTYIDNTFSPYKNDSEVSQINRHEITEELFSKDMKTILYLGEETKKETDGYFDMYKNGKFDPSGIVKGWAICHASKILEQKGYKNFYVDAGGDVQVKGKNNEGAAWTVGIQNPFNTKEIVKIIVLKDKGIATSGTAIRGQHIYNPHKPDVAITDIVSITVIGPNVYEADRFATAAFAMGSKGIYFIENLSGLEGYMIDKKGIATYTKDFNTAVVQSNAKSSDF
jgi:thiamine biosynthesis lipoprotein